jgi:hypothetical protein
VAVLESLLDLASWLLNKDNRKAGVSEGTDIDNSKKKDVKKSGIGIRIIGIVRFLFIVGRKVLNYLLLKIAQSAMVIMELIVL